MLTTVLKLLLSKDIKRFPILAAASAAEKRCHTCARSQASSRTLYKAAILQLRNNNEFKLWIKASIGLPVVLFGVTILE